MVYVQSESKDQHIMYIDDSGGLLETLIKLKLFEVNGDSIFSAQPRGEWDDKSWSLKKFGSREKFPIKSFDKIMADSTDIRTELITLIASTYYLEPINLNLSFPNGEQMIVNGFKSGCYYQSWEDGSKEDKG